MEMRDGRTRISWRHACWWESRQCREAVVPKGECGLTMRIVPCIARPWTSTTAALLFRLIRQVLNVQELLGKAGAEYKEFLKSPMRIAFMLMCLPRSHTCSYGWVADEPKY